jgi:two-component system, NarL family, invasion response regulator UvrY
MVRILHKDDHPIIRLGVKNILTGKMPNAMIDEAGDDFAVLDRIKKTEYDLVILDVSVPMTSSFNLARNILEIKPEAKILMFSMHQGDIHSKKFFHLGAKGYIQKDASLDQLLEAVAAILCGGVYFNSVSLLLCYMHYTSPLLN